MEVGLFSNQIQHLAQALGDLLAEQQSRHQGFERGMRIGIIDAFDRAQVGLVTGG